MDGDWYEIVTTLFYNICINLFDVFNCSVLLQAFNKRKSLSNIITASVYAAVAISCVAIYNIGFVTNNIFLRMLSEMLIFAGAMKLTFDVGYGKACIQAVLFLATTIAVEFITSIIIYFVFGDSAEIKQNSIAEALVLIVFNRILCFLIFYLIKMVFQRKSTDVVFSSGWVKLMLFPVFSLITTAAIIIVFPSITNGAQANALNIIAFGFMFMNIFLYYLINDIVERETKLREKSVANMYMERQLENFKMMQDNYERERRIIHEYKNQLFCIGSLLKSQQYEELEEYLKRIGSELDEGRNVIATGNALVDSIINVKFREAKAKEIVMPLEIENMAKAGITDEDFVIIIANLLDNAIEACEKCAGEKIIRVQLRYQNDKLFIAVSNTYNGKVKGSKILPETQKADAARHGFGLKNIKSIVEKYNGTMVISPEEKFMVSIMI